MFRRRLLSIVGALGLVTGLLSSGVAAHAATTQGPDWTYLGLLATFSWSSHDVCYSNGAYQATNPCVITQAPGGKRNIAVCVQSSNDPLATETCSISQTNTTFNNYALVIQRVQQSGCALIAPCQKGTQTASIQQITTSSGWNFGGAFQNTSQSIGQRDDDPLQTNTQHVQVLAPSTGPGGLEQVSASGSNFGAVSQSSSQSASGDLSQTQFADQVAGHSFFNSKDGIDQTAPNGSNAAFLIHTQKQQLDASPSQTQTAKQDGDITQNGLQGNNLAAGTQLQDQLENAPPGGFQEQTGDPKCCSPQNGGNFYVTIKTKQFANNIVPATATNQHETIVGNCDSIPNGTCHMSLSATQQGVTTTAPPCPTPSSCHQQIILNPIGT